MKNAEKATEKVQDFKTVEVDETVDKVKEEKDDTETKPALTSKRGKKVTRKETISIAKKNKREQDKQKEPTGKKMKIYTVLSNLKKDGEIYEEGDTFEALPCKEIDTLIEIKVIK